MPLDFSDLSSPMFDISFQMARRGQSVVLIRSGAAQAAQTAVWARDSTSVNTTESNAGRAGKDTGSLIGYRSYAGQTDFNVQKGDQFKIGSTIYTVYAVDDSLPNRREARCEGLQ